MGSIKENKTHKNIPLFALVEEGEEIGDEGVGGVGGDNVAMAVILWTGVALHMQPHPHQVTPSTSHLGRTGLLNIHSNLVKLCLPLIPMLVPTMVTEVLSIVDPGGVGAGEVDLAGRGRGATFSPSYTRLPPLTDRNWPPLERLQSNRKLDQRIYGRA